MPLFKRLLNKVANFNAVFRWLSMLLNNCNNCHTAVKKSAVVAAAAVVVFVSLARHMNELHSVNKIYI